MTLLIIINWY